METLTRAFNDEAEATAYWESMSGQHRPKRPGVFLADGRRVISNELRYLKNGSYLVITKVEVPPGLDN